MFLKFSKVAKDGVTLTNFELDEEDRERDAMRILVYQNQTVFASLFLKYSQVSQQVNQQLSKRKIQPVQPHTERTISFLEIQKFLKDHGTDNS